MIPIVTDWDVYGPAPGGAGAPWLASPAVRGTCDLERAVANVEKELLENRALVCGTIMAGITGFRCRLDKHGIPSWSLLPAADLAGLRPWHS